MSHKTFRSRRLRVRLHGCQKLSKQVRDSAKVSEENQGSLLVLCDTRDTSILTVDTYVTIPVSPKSRYTAVYRSNKKYRETAQVSRVSRYHASRTTGNEQPASVRCQNERIKVTHWLTVKHYHCYQQSLSHEVLLHCQSLCSIVIKEGLTPRGQRTRTQISNTFVDLKYKSM